MRLQTTTPGAQQGGRADVCLRRFFQVGGERDNLSALLYRHPLHFRFEPRRNVELNHLCHNHPPIHRSSPGFFRHHRARRSAHCSIRCGGSLEESGSIWAAGSATFLESQCFIPGYEYGDFTTIHVGTDVLIRPVERSSTWFFAASRRCEQKKSGALLRRTDEGVRPYVVRGGNCGVSR
jgi:hypothetical protein